MKVYYLNDERQEITLRILDVNYDPSGDNKDTYFRMKACEGRMFDVTLPEGAVLWIKKWPGMVMLSYLDQSVAEQFAQPQQPPRNAASE